MLFLSHLVQERACCLLLASRRVLFHIAPSRCLPMHDVFGQRHLTTETCCKVWTQETHCSCTRHVPRRVPRPCPCTTGVMKSTTHHLCAVTHAAETMAQETHCSCTRHVPRRMSRPCPCTTGVMKSTTEAFICNHTCSRGHGIGDTLQLHKARTKARASSMPVHNRCNEINNRSFICNHACSKGHGTEDTLQLHKARTKARASSMPMHNRCNKMNNKSFISSHACS